MATNNARQERSTGLQALEGSSEPAILPEEWLDSAIHPGIDDDEEEFLPVLCQLERELADADILAGRNPGRPEDTRIRVLYVSRDGHRRVEESFQAKVIETGDGTEVEPRRLLAAIGVDGDVTEPSRAPVDPKVRAALATLHGVTIPPGESE